MAHFKQSKKYAFGNQHYSKADELFDHAMSSDSSPQVPVKSVSRAAGYDLGKTLNIFAGFECSNRVLSCDVSSNFDENSKTNTSFEDSLKENSTDVSFSSKDQISLNKNCECKFDSDNDNSTNYNYQSCLSDVTAAQNNSTYYSINVSSFLQNLELRSKDSFANENMSSRSRKERSASQMTDIQVTCDERDSDLSNPASGQPTFAEDVNVKLGYTESKTSDENHQKTSEMSFNMSSCSDNEPRRLWKQNDRFLKSPSLIKTRNNSHIRSSRSSSASERCSKSPKLNEAELEINETDSKSLEEVDTQSSDVRLTRSRSKNEIKSLSPEPIVNTESTHARTSGSLHNETDSKSPEVAHTQSSDVRLTRSKSKNEIKSLSPEPIVNTESTHARTSGSLHNETDSECQILFPELERSNYNCCSLSLEPVEDNDDNNFRIQYELESKNSYSHSPSLDGLQNQKIDTHVTYEPIVESISYEKGETEKSEISELLDSVAVEELPQIIEEEVPESCVPSYNRVISDKLSRERNLVVKNVEMSRDSLSQKRTNDHQALRQSLFTSRQSVFCGVFNHKALNFNNVMPLGLPVPPAFKVCGNKNLRSFSTVIDSVPGEIEKIGEGAFSEVFRFTVHNNFHEVEVKVLKVIAIKNEQDRRNVDGEYEITSTLSELCQNFVHVYDAWYVSGKYPQTLIDAWLTYQRLNPDEALNDCPTQFPASQRYCLLLLEDAGIPFEKFIFKSIDQAVAVIQQLACSLAMAESDLEFEHRDLHMSNVMLKMVREKVYHYNIGSKTLSVVTRGIKVTIIDYTLSRLKINQQVKFNDLSTEKNSELFEEYDDLDELSKPQFDIYKMMKKVVKNSWKDFVPETNLLWLYHVTDRLLYWKRKTDFVTYNPDKRDKLKKVYLELASDKYKSCTDVVTKSNLMRI